MPNLRCLTLDVNRFLGGDAVFKTLPEFIQQSSGQLEVFSCEATYLQHEEILLLLEAIRDGATSPTTLRKVHLCARTVSESFLTELRDVCAHIDEVTLRWAFVEPELTSMRLELSTGSSVSWDNMKFLIPVFGKQTEPSCSTADRRYPA